MVDTFLKNILIVSLIGENITALLRYCSLKIDARLIVQNVSFRQLGGRNLLLDTYIPIMPSMFLFCFSTE